MKDQVEVKKQAPVIPSTSILWGPRGVGKTWAGINSPFGPRHIIDVENSAYDYEVHMQRLIKDGGLRGEFTRVSAMSYAEFMDEMVRLNDMRNAEAKPYGTIIVDTVGQVTEWYKQHEFQKAGPQKAEKMAPVIWGDIRARLRSMLHVLNGVADLVILTAHERSYNNVYSPRCNPAVLEMCGLSVRLSKGPNQKVPNALITARLPFLPPRIEGFTIERVTEYLSQPVDWNNLKDEEKAPADEQPVYTIPEGEDE